MRFLTLHYGAIGVDTTYRLNYTRAHALRAPKWRN
jgi:hypothetical protein